MFQPHQLFSSCVSQAHFCIWWLPLPQVSFLYLSIHVSSKYLPLTDFLDYQFQSSHDFNITSFQSSWHSSLYKIMASIVRQPGFKSLLCYLLAMGPLGMLFECLCLRSSSIKKEDDETVGTKNIVSLIPSKLF